MQHRNAKQHSKKYRETHRQQERERYARWYAKHGKAPHRRKRRAEQMRQYRRDPTKRARHVARWIANHALESGKIMKLPCSECGAENAQKHHPDYTKPLLIVWLCAPCHRQLHANAEKGAK